MLTVRLMAPVLAALLIGSGAGAGPSAPRFYRVAHRDGVWSVVVPGGRPFFSVGVDCVERGATREGYRADKPQYASFRHYATDADWAGDTLSRLRSWGFNTLGAWSDDATLCRAAQPFPYTVELELGGTARAPWCDLFGHEIERTFDEIARAQVVPRRDDPLLLGYFTDNELGWWDDTIFVTFLKAPPANATRRVLIDLLRQHYSSDFARLLRDWQPDGTASFDELARGGTLTLRPGGRGMAVVQRFVYLCAQRYYRLARDTIRRYDRNHLILGDRYAQWSSEPVVRAAAPCVDVVSTNFGADWTDGGICRYYLDTLHRLTGKPVLVTEFYFAAMENRSGNRNSSAGFPTVRTQQERADGYRRNVLAFAALPYVVGAHWFQYYDEPTNGRSDGENFDMGLVDIENRPYEELTAAAVEASRAVPRVRAVHPARGGRGSIPPAGSDATDGLRAWDRDRSFIPASTGPAFADLYACWDAHALYLAVYGTDYVDEHLYEAGTIPEGERTVLAVTLGARRHPIVVRFGAGGKAAVEGSRGEVREWPGLKHAVLLTIPAEELGRSTLSAGDALVLGATLTRHSRAGTMRWKACLRLGVHARESANAASALRDSAPSRPLAHD